MAIITVMEPNQTDTACEKDRKSFTLAREVKTPSRSLAPLMHTARHSLSSANRHTVSAYRDWTKRAIAETTVIDAAVINAGPEPRFSKYDRAPRGRYSRQRNSTKVVNSTTRTKPAPRAETQHSDVRNRSDSARQRISGVRSEVGAIPLAHLSKNAPPITPPITPIRHKMKIPFQLSLQSSALLKASTATGKIAKSAAMRIACGAVRCRWRSRTRSERAFRPSPPRPSDRHSTEVRCRTI